MFKKINIISIGLFIFIESLNNKENSFFNSIELINL